MTAQTEVKTKGPEARKSGGWLSSKRYEQQRRFKRFSCHIEAYFQLSGGDYAVDGVLLDISQQGALFRPRSMFIMRLRNEYIELKFESVSIEGYIVNTTPAGYGVKFNTLLDEESIEIMVSK